MKYHSPCAFENYDHLPCQIVPKILKFDGTYLDQITICELIFLQVAAICGITHDELEEFLDEMLNVYIGPYPDHVTEQILNTVEEKNE